MDAPAPSLVERWDDPNVWSTNRIAAHRQFDYWRQFVVEAHLHWAIPRLQYDCFPAYLRQGRFDGFRVTHITSQQGGIVGKRTRWEIAQDKEALFNLIYVPEGSIDLIMDGRDVVLTPGSFTLWDTTREMTFITGEGLRQITFVMPQEALLRLLPRAGEFVGHRIEANSGVSRMFISHLLSLEAGFGQLAQTAAGPVMNATMELLIATLTSSVELPPLPGASALPQRVKAYALTRLDDPDLTVRDIAAAHAISTRHLHRLFEAEGTTPAAWIRDQRLDRCRRDLISPTSRDLSVTEIAYRWGFRDSATFSRAFRRAFGISPRTARLT